MHVVHKRLSKDRAIRSVECVKSFASDVYDLLIDLNCVIHFRQRSRRHNPFNGQ